MCHASAAEILKDDSFLVARRKAVRAAVVLLPLLGITNILFMIEAPLDNVRKFALWSYSTHFLRSFQGLFIATLYCFLNGEVKNTNDSEVETERLKCKLICYLNYYVNLKRTSCLSI